MIKQTPSKSSPRQKQRLLPDGWSITFCANPTNTEQKKSVLREIQELRACIVSNYNEVVELLKQADMKEQKLNYYGSIEHCLPYDVEALKDILLKIIYQRYRLRELLGIV